MAKFYIDDHHNISGDHYMDILNGIIKDDLNIKDEVNKNDTIIINTERDITKDTFTETEQN
jgi:hypothetical protein